jgi:hypothetical protein
MFFLRNLANMSCMVPFWASTGSGFVPIWGARDRSHAVQRRLFILLMTAAHISPDVFSLRKFLSNIQELFLTVQSNIIHTSYTSHLYVHLHLLFYTSCSHIHFFGSSWQAGCPRLLVSDTLAMDIWPFSDIETMTLYYTINLTMDIWPFFLALRQWHCTILWI